MKKLFLILALGMFTTAYAFTPVANPANALKANKRFAFDATQISAPQVAEAQEANATLTFSGIEFDYQGIYKGKYLYLVLLYGQKSASYLPQAYFWITKDTNEKNFVGNFDALQTLYDWGTGDSDYAVVSNGKISITKGEKYNYTVSGSFTYESTLYSFSTTADAEYNDESYPYEPAEATTLDLKTTGEIDLSYLSYGYVDIYSEDASGNVLVLSFYSSDKSITTIPDGTYNIKGAADAFLPGYFYADWETTAEQEFPVNCYAETTDYVFYLAKGTVVAKNDAKGLHLTVNATSEGGSTVTAECLVPAAGAEPTDKRAIYLNTGGYWWGNDRDYYIHAWKDKNNPTTVKFEYVADYLYRAYINKDYTGAFIFYLSPNETITSIDEIWDNYLWDNRETTIPSDKDMYVITSSYMGVWSALEYGEWAVYDAQKSEESYAYGSCGAKVEYAVKRNTNTLVISGTGDMDHYSTSNSENPRWYWAPWEGWRYIISALSLSEGITTIGAYAFELCPNITKVTIPSTVTAIGTGAFNAKGFTSITCKATTPPKMVESPKTSTTKHIFQDADFSIPLYVPSGSVVAYKKADYWKDFTNIQAIDGSGEEGEGEENEYETITVAKSLDLGAALATNEIGITTYHIIGYVTNIVSNDFNTSYNDMTFWIADTNNGATSNEEGGFRVYRGKPDVELIVGDKIQVTTRLTNFNGVIESMSKASVIRLSSADPNPGGTSEYTITVLASDSRLGSVKGSGTYEKGDKVMLSATAGKGARFDRWSDGVTSASRTITVSGDATYTAIFLAIASNNSDKVTKGYNNYAEKSGVVEPTNGKGLAPKNAEQSDTEEDTTTLEPARKIFRDGHIYILRDGKVYSLTGMQL